MQSFIGSVFVPDWFLAWPWPLRRGRDVLVDAEEIGWVVLGLDCSEAVPGCARVCLAQSVRALVVEEVDVRAPITLPKHLHEAHDPLLVVGRLTGLVV